MDSFTHLEACATLDFLNSLKVFQHLEKAKSFADLKNGLHAYLLLIEIDSKFFKSHFALK